MLWSSMGLPATQRNCLSSVEPVRDPLPAATMMTPTSRFPLPLLAIEQLPEEITDRAHTDHLDPTRSPVWNPSLGHVGGRHPHLRCLSKPALGLRDGSDFASKPDLAEKDRRVRDRPIVHARCECARNRQITGRLLHPHSANDIQEDIKLRERQACALVKHCQEQRQPPRIETRADALWSSVAGFGRESLNLDEHRTRALQERSDGAAGRIVESIAEEKLGWILYSDQSFLRHPENADLVNASESVLGRAKDPVLQHSLAFEVEHGIDDVLERLGTSDAAALGDVANGEYRCLRLLGEAH